MEPSEEELTLPAPEILGGPPPAAPPRAVTARVSRRSWAEPRVRLWWVLSLSLLVVGAFAAMSGIYTWAQDRSLLRAGTPVMATVLTADGDHVVNRAKSPESLVELEFPWEGGRAQVAGKLEGRQDPIVIKSKVPIRVDPKDPARWTGRVTGVPLWHELLGAAIAVAAALAALVVGAARRAAVLQTWRIGEAAGAAVVDVKQTALAPRSQLVRCVPAGQEEGQERRVVEVYVPLSVARLEKGDEIWVLHPPGRPTRALAAAWFE